MSEILNARDMILQAATLRTEPVMLPPTVVVPPGQIGAGSLPEAVTGAGGNTLVHEGNFQAQTVIAKQIDSRGLTIKDDAGVVLFSAGVNLSSSRVDGLGALASKNVVDLATQAVGFLDGPTRVTNMGPLAYATVVAAERIVGGAFTGQTFTGGTFTGTTFSGITVRSSDLLEAFDMTASGTSTITNLIVKKDIFSPNAVINTRDLTASNNVTANNDVRTVNLYVSGATSFANVYANNDVSAAHLYSRNSLTVAGYSSLQSVGATDISCRSLNTNGGNISGGSITASWDLKCENLYAFSSVSGAGFNNFLRKGSHRAIFDDGGGDRAVTITFN